MREITIRPILAELNGLSFDSCSRCLVVANECVDQIFMRALCGRVIDSKCALFAAWGIDCKSWENLMDDLIVERLSSEALHSDFTLTTTSHPGETLQDAIDFVLAFSCEETETSQKIIVKVLS